MKQYVFAAFMLTSLHSMSQLKNVQTTDSSIIIDNIYAGVLSSTDFSTKNLRTTPSVNFRIGAKLTWNINKMITARSLGMIETNLEKTTGTQLFFFQVKPIHQLMISFGHMPTLSTEQRPVPTTANGQFETWTQAKIPGATPGAKINYKATPTLSVGVGVAERSGSSEYHANVVWKKMTLSGYYRRFDRRNGFALSFNDKAFYTVIVFVPKSLVATTTVFNFSRQISAYGDIGYGIAEREFLRTQIGVMKAYQSTWVGGLVCLGYNPNTNSINGYLFVHL